MRDPQPLRVFSRSGLLIVFIGCRVLAGAGSLSAQETSQPSGEAVEGFAAGLLAAYDSVLEPRTTVVRVDAKPALYLNDGSIHPRLPPGAFEVTWSGYLRIDDAGPLRIGAYLAGALLLEVDGVTMLEGRGDSERAWVDSQTPLEREPGLYPLKIRYRSPERLPARLQLWWEGAEFSREPLPPWRLSHRLADMPDDALQEAETTQGRDAARRLGCARCHASAFPGLHDPPPGPSLADLRGRVKREWFLAWLDDPWRARPNARMPSLFSRDRAGFLERWIIAEHLTGAARVPEDDARNPGGNHRMGRRVFASVGCAACHFLPDVERGEQPDLARLPLIGLGDRFRAESLAAFIAEPLARYPDGRMPRLPLAPEAARDAAAYLLLWSRPGATAPGEAEAPARDELDAVARRLGTSGLEETAVALLREKRCGACHPGLGDAAAEDVPMRAAAGGAESGCLAGDGAVRFAFGGETKELLSKYVRAAAKERHPSPLEERRRSLERAGCARCHQRDTDRPPPIEEAGSLLGGAWLELLPFQRTPRLTYAFQKFTSAHLVSSVRDGVSGLRPPSYSYRMPAFGPAAIELVRAMAEADGEPPSSASEHNKSGASEQPDSAAGDPTLASLAGPELVGFQGYSCIACHLWNGQAFSSPDPGAVGSDLTKVAGRISREWFDRFLEAPARAHPGTPMPAFFPKGQLKGLASVLDGDLARQKEVLWSYLALGKGAPSPKPPPPSAVEPPRSGEPPIVALIPVRLPGGAILEGLCVLYPSHEIVVYDVAAGALRAVYAGARLLRGVHGRVRTYTIDGDTVEIAPAVAPAASLLGGAASEGPWSADLRGYDRLADGMRVRSAARTGGTVLELAETFSIVSDGEKRVLVHEVRSGERTVSSRHDLPPPRPPPPMAASILVEAGRPEGSLERPGYRAVALPRPRTPSGEDLLMPSALAADPQSGRVFVASMKMGEVFVLDDPSGDSRAARFIDYARGLFQEAYSMLAEDGALYILHRRSLTRATDSDGDGLADRFDRIALLPQGVADAYDYGYGLVRDKTGAFVISHAPHANAKIPGSGGALRLSAQGDSPPQEIAFGCRNPLGWCLGPEGAVFFTDNQGEWVAANKLCHVVEGRYYGFPNPARKEHASKPAGRAAVWVPYAWAKSVNGVAYDGTGGKFGPFAGQFFLAELMFGGAIIRASLEKVNGEYQGACFPFWGKGLLGPLVLAFDREGSLFVGAITEPGWMSQPDRGALFRIGFTGETPFEMLTIRVLPRGFRIEFTTPALVTSVRELKSYRVERYRYEYTGAYGSPELDRTEVPLERVEASADGLSAELTLPSLVKDRVYRIGAAGVRSLEGRPLVHPVGAYTLNEVP